jgi:hypothetical protein
MTHGFGILAVLKAENFLNNYTTGKFSVRILLFEFNHNEQKCSGNGAEM